MSPSPTTAQKTEPAPPKGEPVQTPPTEPSKPDTKLEDKPPAPEPVQPSQQALAPQEPAPPPPPTLERELPPVETPPAPLTSKDFPKPVPPPPPPPAKPQARPAPQPGPQPQLRPSPLSQFSQKRAPSGNAQGDQASATFVNPAAQANKTRVVEQYLWQVTQRIAQYQPYLKERNVQGTVIVRLVIAHDGRLLGSSIAQSSGIIDLDQALMESVRAAAPFPPLPSEIADAQVAFRVPLGFRPR
jgi:protein TonB